MAVHLVCFVLLVSACSVQPHGCPVPVCRFKKTKARQRARCSSDSDEQDERRPSCMFKGPNSMNSCQLPWPLRASVTSNAVPRSPHWLTGSLAHWLTGSLADLTGAITIPASSHRSAPDEVWLIRPSFVALSSWDRGKAKHTDSIIR